MRYLQINRVLLVTVFILSLIHTQGKVLAQERLGFYMPEGVHKVEIPFELHSNLIVIPVTINKMLTLRFILDTGAESAILTEKVFSDALGLTFIRTIRIDAPGVIDTLSAYVASNVTMSLPGGVTATGINVLVLKEDYLELRRNLGAEVYGIIGYDIFSRFVVDIDYDTKKITLYRPDKFRPRRFAERIPLEIRNTKPYVRALIHQKKSIDSVRLLVDTGASHALLLDVENSQLSMPEKLIAVKLGQGLGGEIPGYVGRMPGYRLGQYSFEDVLVSIPLQGAYLNAIKRGSRHGTMGGELLSRFHVSIDYQHQAMYLYKSQLYGRKFEHDMSGLHLVVNGEALDTLMVGKVRPGTPADEAGLAADDVILKVNGRTLQNSTFSTINRLLRKKEGYRIKMVVLKNGVRVKKSFRLKKMI